MRAILAALLLIFTATPLLAQRIAFQPKVSTLGGGADVILGISPHLNFRAGAQLFSMTETLEESDIIYDGDLELRSGNLLFDLYPTAGGFRISAGAILNDNSFTGRSTEDTLVVVNGVSYPVALVGVIAARVTTDPAGPYLGLGFGNPLSSGSPWRVTLDLGAFYQGEPQVELTATPFLPIPLPGSFQEDLAEEERKLQADVRKYKVYPVVSIGVAYRF